MHPPRAQRNPAPAVMGLLVLLISGLAGCSYLQETRSGGTVEQYAGGSQTSSTATTAGERAMPSGMPACVCHSKNPAMVRMHDSLGGEDCGACHSPEENLMDPNRTPTSKAAVQERIKTEPICIECHKSDGTVVTQSNKGKVKISGALFCPTCKKQLKTSDTTCGECGGTVTKHGDAWECSACGSLVDINKVAAMSKEKPSNDICALCHYDTKGLTVAHSQIAAYNKSVAEVPGGLSNCLSCHKSHNQCGGCHF